MSIDDIDYASKLALEIASEEAEAEKEADRESDEDEARWRARWRMEDEEDGDFEDFDDDFEEYDDDDLPQMRFYISDAGGRIYWEVDGSERLYSADEIWDWEIRDRAPTLTPIEITDPRISESDRRSCKQTAMEVLQISDMTYWREPDDEV